MALAGERTTRRPKLSERVVSAIRAQVLSGAVPAGQKLPTESQLTAKFGVSRTVVREAIATLAGDGLVEARQGAGVFVKHHPALAFGTMSHETGNKISHALNILEVRMGIEIESAGLAALRRNSAQEALIQEAFFEFDRMLSLGQPTGKCDFAFHRAIAAATNNPFYVEVLDALGTRAIPCDVESPWGTDRILTREYQEGLQREHLALLKAISRGDAKAARNAMRAHLSASQERYRKLLSGQQAEYVPVTRSNRRPSHPTERQPLMAHEHISFSTRSAIDPAAATRMGTEELRGSFHVGGLFAAGRINLTYTHYDRMIVGGAMPLDAPLALDPIPPTGTRSFLERRELVAINLGGAGSAETAAGRFQLGKRDMLYAGTGESVSFASDDAAEPAKLYLLSAPAHQAQPTRLIRIDEAKRIDLGSGFGANERSIFQYIHPEGAKTCQIVAGMTRLAPGSVWNTMPPHVHDRRMEVYLYFDLDESARVVHLLGEPGNTRHIIVANEEAVLSPPWSIHAGVGTASYWFIWAMAGDNVDYTDVDAVPIQRLR